MKQESETLEVHSKLFIPSMPTGMSMYKGNFIDNLRYSFIDEEIQLNKVSWIVNCYWVWNWIPFLVVSKACIKSWSFTIK